MALSGTRKPNSMECSYKCPEVRELFSPYLDGETSPEESGLLTGHLLLCDDCREEFDLWKKISNSLSLEAVEEEPSAGFSSRVVSRLDNQRKAQALPGRRLFSTWRAAAAAAAAAVMIFAGSWGVGVALKDTGQKPGLVADNTLPEKTIIDSTLTSPAQTGQPGGQSGGDKPAAPADQPGTTDNEVKPPIKDTAAPRQVSPAQTVLLSSNKNIPSTTIKISTNSPATSRDIALNMAAGLGGSGQVLNSQKKADGYGDLIIIIMTVSRNNGPTLVSQLSGLGGIIERSDGKADITSDYNAALNRLADIQATIDSGINDGEKSRLESEASALKRQIEKWDSEVAQYTVILWLEQQ